MPDAGRRAYAYSKACGIIAKSFVGKRISSLAGLHTLSEFDRFVFPERTKDLPGSELLVDLENRVINRTVRHILSILNVYEKPPELLVRLLRSYEYSDLKTCLHYIDSGKKEAPLVCSLGNYGTVHFEAYPDLAAMLAGTEFEPLLSDKAVKGADFSVLEIEIDRLYYRSLKESLFELRGEDREIAHRLIAEEISLRNCIWAFRLRNYFNKSAEDTGDYIMDIKMRAAPDITGRNYGRGTISLASDALVSLDFQLDTRSQWRGWRWERFLNPEYPGEQWYLDPKYFQNAASKYLYRSTMRCFRRAPMSVSMVFCYIKLKQFEENILTSIVEGIGLGMASDDILELLGVSA
ncbi:MAG: V-type ATPase subunit [Treponema sp.]|jgi:vacuolar-type H+-ATPase subunit C/Vma6|nr:V-type ATPase subunit [Treponema sp.]